MESNFHSDELSYLLKSYADSNMNYKNIEHIKVVIHLDRQIKLK